MLGKYNIEPFPANRRFIIDALTAGVNRNASYGLLELDVTLARQSIREFRRCQHRPASFLAWFIKCLSQAVSENPEVQIYRHGRRKMVTFKDVDVAISVERFVGGKSINLPTVVRQANLKSLSEITAAIDGVKKENLRTDTVVLGEKRPLLEWLAKWMPAFARRLYWRRLKSDAFMIKKTMGTVSVTSLGMFGKSSGYIFPNAIHNLGFGLGSLNQRPGLDPQGRIAIRQYLHLTFYANHETVDGAPLARFIARLTELVENAWGLE